MDSAKLNDWMQVVGIFAVVLSLIFVGLQMRQDQKIAIAGQYQDRYAVAMDFWTAREASPVQVQILGNTLIERWGLPNGIDESTTAAEFGSLYLFMRATIGIYDNLHFQYENGLFPPEAWQPYENGLKSIIHRDDQLARYVLSNVREEYRQSFINLCDELGLESP